MERKPCPYCGSETHGPPVGTNDLSYHWRADNCPKTLKKLQVRNHQIRAGQRLRNWTSEK